jgi:hypothetical protein
MNYAEVTFIYINISSTPYRKEDSYLSLSVGQATKIKIRQPTQVWNSKSVQQLIEYIKQSDYNNQYLSN